MSKTIDGMVVNLQASLIRSASLEAKIQLGISLSSEEQIRYQEEKFIQNHVKSSYQDLKSKPRVSSADIKL